MAAGSIELLALTMGQILGPLEDRLAAGEVRLLFAELGLDFPPELDDQADFVDAIATVATDAARLAELVPELLGAIEADDSGEIVRTGGEIVEVAGTLVPALSAI